MEFVLDIMDVQKGHDEIKYTENEAEIKKVRERILDEIRKGGTLYGGVKGGELKKIADLQSLQKAPDKYLFVEEKLKELDRFIVSKHLERKLIAPPLVSG
ncbi:MAG: hypothetical protein DA328_09185 [Nitrososphaeraceae archaeon]|nr:hypothetical protein [Nitrososphaeraceae archaeon]